MTTISIRDVSLFMQVMGQGYPLVLMHGDPGQDYTTLLPLKPLTNQFTLIFYDHRSNGQSDTVPYRELATKLHMTEVAVKVAMHRLRQRYRELLREHIAQTVSGPEQIEDEIRALFVALAS